MKLRTLLAMMIVLLCAVLAVACGGGDDTTTADPGTQAPGATTTKATTTKKTTTKKSTTTKVTTTKATTLPREITFDIPAKLPNNKDYDAALMFDGTESDLEIINKKDGGTYEIMSLENGNKVFAYHITKDWLEGSVSFEPFLFNGDEDGILVYADISDTKPNDLACIGPRFKIYGSWYQIGSHSNSLEKKAKGDVSPDVESNYGYYMVDGTGEWVKAENYSNCRLEVTSQFKGWIYMPFDQVSQNGANLQSLGEFIAMYPGEVDLVEVMIYLGNVNVAEGQQSSDCYFDNFIVVTEK